MCRIVYNVVDKEILCPFLSELQSNCRGLTVCNYRHCLGIRKYKVKYIVFKEVTMLNILFLKRSLFFVYVLLKFLVVTLIRTLQSMFFDNYKKGRDYFNLNLDIASFCRCLSDSLIRKFHVEAEVFLSKKKIVHIAFDRPLISYDFFDEMISFIEHYWL